MVHGINGKGRVASLVAARGDQSRDARCDAHDADGSARDEIANVIDGADGGTKPLEKKGDDDGTGAEDEQDVVRGLVGLVESGNTRFRAAIGGTDGGRGGHGNRENREKGEKNQGNEPKPLL